MHSILREQRTLNGPLNRYILLLFLLLLYCGTANAMEWEIFNDDVDHDQRFERTYEVNADVLTLAASNETIFIQRNTGILNLTGNRTTVVINQNVGILKVAGNEGFIMVLTNTGLIKMNGTGEVKVHTNYGRVDGSTDVSIVVLNEFGVVVQ